MKIDKKFYHGGNPTYFLYGELELNENGLNETLAKRIKDIRCNSENIIQMKIEGFAEWKKSLLEDHKKSQIEKEEIEREIATTNEHRNRFINSRFIHVN